MIFESKYQESEDGVVSEGDNVGHEPEVRLVVPVEEVVRGNVLVALFGFPGIHLINFVTFHNFLFFKSH